MGKLWNLLEVSSPGPKGLTGVLVSDHENHWELEIRPHTRKYLVVPGKERCSLTFG